MADLDRAIAAAREALARDDLRAKPATAIRCVEALRDLLAALDAARGEAVAWADDDEIRRSREYGGSFNAWLSKYPGNDTPLYAAPPASLALPADYALGETIYTPPSEEVRFCYSRGQPNNINASRLGEACRRAAEKPGGDYIDGGLSLLKELEARGYGVFRFAKSAHEQAQQPAAAVPADNVTPMRQPRADLARLVESINAAVYANGDGLSVTEAIGALELAKLELFKEQEQ